MKPMRLVLGLAALLAAALSSCTYNTVTPPEEVHYHHYRTVSTPSYSKSSAVSGGYSSSAPESFQAVTPPHSYSN